MEDDRYTRITLRIPKELHLKLQEQADATSKSTNAEIIARLENTFLARPEAQAMNQLLANEANETIRGQIEERLEQRRLYERFYEMHARITVAKITIDDLKQALEHDMPADELDARIFSATLRSKIASMNSTLTWSREHLKAMYAELEKSNKWLVVDESGRVKEAPERPKNWPPAELFEDADPL